MKKRKKMESSITPLHKRADIFSLITDVRWKWTLSLLVLFALWNDVYMQGPLNFYESGAQFACPVDSSTRKLEVAVYKGDWSSYGGYCHNVIFNASSWQEASRICARKYGVLLSSNDWMEAFEISNHLHALVSASMDDPSQAVFWTAYQIASSKPTSMFSQRHGPMPIYSPLWALGEPSLTSDLNCVALDANVGDPNRYGWRVVDCQTPLPFVCSFLACQPNQFRCSDNTKCLDASWACDGVEDCPDASDENSCPIECGSEIQTNMSGSIASPNYPKSHYPDDAQCFWQILLPKQYKITLKITAFDTERSHDVLYVREGTSVTEWDSARDAFNKSGSLGTDRFQYRSATNSLLLKFVSDDSITRPGFLLSWEANDTIKNCVLEAPLIAAEAEKELFSPGYQIGQYPYNVMCEWVIQSQNEGSVVSVQFTDFQLARGDWVKIYNQLDEDVLIDTYSSDHPPTVITSSRQALKLVFFSDFIRSAKGFSLSYKSGCAPLAINSTYAYFKSPNVGHFGQLSCQWKLFHPTGRKITVLFRDFTLLGDDFVKVGDVTYNSESAFEPVTSVTGILVVNFQSINPNSHFSASFSENCPPLPSVNHGAPSTVDTHYGVLVNYKCATGYALIGNENVTCGPNGNWSSPPPKCDAIVCTAPPKTAFGILQTIRCSQTTKPSPACIADYICVPGCIQETMQMHCSTDGRWSPVSGVVCQPSKCGKPPDPPVQAAFVDSSNNTYHVNDVIRYQCVRPYLAIGPAYAVCSMTGEWLRSNFSCELPTCSSSGVAYSSTEKSQLTLFGQVLHNVQCLAGFRQKHEEYKCDLNGTWTPELSCDDIDECETNNITCPGGNCKNLKGSWTCVCDRGWQWNDSTGHCEDINECQLSMHECDNDILCENTQGGYTCNCFPGYQLFNGRNAFLPMNTSNLRMQKSCIPIQCPRPIYNYNTTYMFTNDTLFSYNAEVTFVCKRSFVAASRDISEFKGVCKENGRWSLESPECVAATCPVPAMVPHGKYTPEFRNGSIVAPGTTIEYFCDENFILSGPKRRVCLESAWSWSDAEPTCEAMQCPKLEPLEGGFVTYQNHRTPGTLVHFYCDPIHRLVGLDSMRCGDDGCWRGSLPSCEALSCELGGLPDLLSPQNLNATAVNVGETVQYDCANSGFVISDSRPLLCSIGGDFPIFPGVPSYAIAAPHSTHTVKRDVGESLKNSFIPQSACSVIKISRITSDSYVEQGETVELSCAVETDCDKFQITWERGAAFTWSGGLIHAPEDATDKENERVAFIQTGAQTYTIQIQNASNRDSGYYWCKVWHQNAVKNQKKVLLIVTTAQNPPDRRKRNQIPADKLSPELEYLYDSGINSTAHWIQFHGSNESGDADMIWPLASVECKAGGQWASDPSGGSCVCKEGYTRMGGQCVKRGPLCYICENANSIVQCNRRSKLQQCHADEICSTIVSNDPQFSLTKRCVRADQCQNRISNFSSCLHGKQDCQICCASDYCNIVPFTTAVAEWNSTFPTCLDVEPPTFFNCSTSNATIFLDFNGNPVVEYENQPAPFPLPVASDNSGRVTVTTQPADLWSLDYKQPVLIALTAKDSANLTATCSFLVTAKKFSENRQNCSEPKNGSAQCNRICETGFYGRGGVEPCFPCPLGFFQPKPRSSKCERCPHKKSTDSPGATNSAQCTDVIPCYHDFCLNGGRCVDSWPENRCVCRPGTFGKRCGHRQILCLNSTCGNNGGCTVNSTNGEFNCACAKGYTGRYCERPVENNFPSVATAKSTDRLCANLQCGRCGCNNSHEFCHWNNSHDPCGCNPCSLCVQENTISCKLRNKSSSFACVCKDGWSGQYCEKISDHCSPETCPNNGTCVSNGTAGRCMCSGLYYSSNCLKRKEPCAISPCENGGACQSINEHYFCSCPEAYHGYHCQRESDPCSDNPCDRGGICRRNSTDPLGFGCQCPSPWAGAHCDADADACSSNPCLNSGTCNSYFDRSSVRFQCICSPGWTGTTCDVPLDPCSDFHCFSGGTCYANDSRANCQCAPPWTGPRCEDHGCADPTACTVNETCVQFLSESQCQEKPLSKCQTTFCDNGGTCRQNDSYSYKCDCPPGFTGDTCADTLDVCAQNMCQNNGTCVPAAKSTSIGYLCICQLGYVGTYCESTISGCDPNPCQNGGTCTDVGNTAQCLCSSLYSGPYCDKAKSQNFNMRFLDTTATKNMSWIVAPDFTLADKMNMMTLCFWVRFDDEGEGQFRQMTYLTVAKIKRSKDFPVSFNLLPLIQFTETGLLLTSLADANKALSVHLPVNDSSWHFICFDWRWSTADWIIYIDGQKFKSNQDYDSRFSFDASTISEGLYIMVLGQSVEKQKFFTGEISLVTLVSAYEFAGSDFTKFYLKCGDYLLNGEGDPLLKASVLVRWIDFTQPEPDDPSVVITYPSVCSQAYCLPERKTCKSDKIPPEVKYCPSDSSFYSQSRLMTVSWKEPHFVDNIEVVRVSSNFRSGQNLPWGEYQVVYIANDKAGNAAVCKFRVYITPFICKELKSPANTTLISCQQFSQGMHCAINCTDEHRLVQKVRPFYVCGVEGAYDPLRPDVPVTVPACSPPVKISNATLWTTVQARFQILNSSACDNETNFGFVKQALLERLDRTDLKISLCGNSSCNLSSAIRIFCENNSLGATGRTKRQAIIRDDDDASYVDFIFTWQASNYSESIELVRSALRSASGPWLSLDSISPHANCPAGSTFIDDICILCSIGTYYDSKTETCSPCPMHKYNSRAGRSSCTRCPANQITVGTGSQFLSDCIENCTAGFSFDYDSRKCAPCPVGTYQPNYGSASCISCAPGQMTSNTGSRSVADCDYVCGPGQELDTSGSSCTPCPVGTYKTFQNESACIRCPMDYTTAGTGSTSSRNCSVLYCSPGKFKTGDHCAACPVGTYQENENQSECKKCSDTRVTQYPGSDSPRDCKNGCADLCGLCSANATCTFEACQTKCVCKPGYQQVGNNTGACTHVCDALCAPDQCVYSNVTDPYCRTPIKSDEKAISIIVGAVSGGFVALVLIITLIIIFKVRLYHFVRCCKKQSVKEMSSNQYYRNTTYPALGAAMNILSHRRRSSAISNDNTRTTDTQQSAISVDPGAESLELQNLPIRSDDCKENGRLKNEFDMMTPGDVYTAIYEGLQGIRGDRALSDYLTSTSHSTAIFENRAYDFDDELSYPPAYEDGFHTPTGSSFARTRFQPPDDDGDYFS